jgi:hypothetical protein
VNRIFFTYTLHNFRFGEIRRRSPPSSLAILMARLAWTCSCATSAISRDRYEVADTAVCGEGSYRYGLLQSDKGGEGDFTAEDEVRLRELAELVGAALDALRFSHERAAA